MKFLMQFGLGCLLASGAFAQHHGGGSGSAGDAGGGRVGSVTAGGHAGRGQRSIHTPGFGRYSGYGYPGFYGYGGLYGNAFDSPSGESDYGPASAGAPGVAMVYLPPAVRPQETAHPVMHDYTPHEEAVAALPEHQTGPVVYLIAFRDKTIRAATTYWVESGSLHYMDTDHKVKQAPMTAIDRDMSAQLNRERQVPFDIQ